MRFDFHKYKTFLECPKKFDLQIRNVPPPVEDNKYFTLFGSAVQKFFEQYANDWQYMKIPWSRAEVVNRSESYWRWLLKVNPVDWGAPFVKLSETELYNQSVDCIVDNLEGFDVYQGTRSEVKIEVNMKSKDTLVGKIDFIKELSDSVEILDGKSTDVLGKNVDPEQLLTYAMLYQFRYGKLPDKLGFLYYRLKRIEYIEWDEAMLEDFKKKLFVTMYVAKKTLKYEATPSAKSCKYCPYRSTCEEHVIEAKGRKRKSKLDMPYDGEITTMGF